MNRMVKVLLFCMTALCCFTVNVYAQDKPRLAILPFTGGTGEDGETIAMLFSIQPEILNAFTVVPRTSNINAIMAEIQIQRSGLTDSDTISDLGKQLNADFVVAGHIQKLGDRNLVLITIINVESLQQIAGDYREYLKIEEIQPLIPAMTKRIIAATRQDTSNLPKLAVLPFNIPKGVNVQDAEVLAQLLATEIANSGKYTVLPRTKTIETAMAEQQIQRSGLTDPSSTKAIGQATNAQYVLSGEVRSLGTLNMFVASILKVENAEQISGDYKNYHTIADGLQLMTELARTLTANMPGTASSTLPGNNPAGKDDSGSVKAPSNEKNFNSGFSTGRKIGAGFLNFALGTGSFTMGDWSGGLTLVAGYAVGWTLIGVELGALKYEDALAGWLGPIGIGVLGISAAYGFIRPFLYHKSTRTTLVDVLDRVHVAIIPDVTGIKAVGLSYSFHY